MNTITVGIQDADIVGSDNTAIQSAIDQLAARGGGTVQVLPGTYTCFDAVRMKSNIRLTGQKEQTVLIAGPTPSSVLAEDADIGEKQITPVCADGFKPGMGVILRDNKKRHTLAPMPLTIERIEKGQLFLNDWIVHDWCAEDGGQVVAYTPLIHAFEAENITIDGFTLDGTKNDAPPDLAGLRGGNLYFRRVQRSLIRNVISRHAYGDGIRCGQSTDFTVEDCETHDNGFYGIHPGSHTQPIRFSRLNIHHNAADGLYLCWGVRNGLIEDCEIHHNGHLYYRNGISIGHKDTGNLFVRNHVYENWKYGVAFREKTAANGAHDNVLRDNVIENNGSRKEDVPASILSQLPHPEAELAGCGIDIKGITRGLVIENNTIRETRSKNSRLQKVGIRIHPGASDLTLTDNSIEGHTGGDLVDLR